jgi:hypothetical protein
MSRRGENWGQLIVDASKGVSLSSTFVGSAGEAILQIPLSSIANATATKTDLSLGLDSSAQGVAVGGVTLASVRFAVPKTCIGFEQTEDAAKEILKKLQGLTGAATGDQAASAIPAQAADLGASIGELQDVSISQPAGLFTATFFMKGVRFTDPKRQLVISVLSSQVVNMFLAPVPGKDAKYVVINLKAPIRIGSSAFAMIALVFSDDRVIPESTPWRLAITAEKIAETFGGESMLTPSMHGPLTEVFCMTLKEVLRTKMLPGGNKEYSTRANAETCALSCTHKGSDGYLFVLKAAFLYLHRPATLISFENILRVEVDEASTGESFVLQVILPKASGSVGKTAEEKLTFSGIDRKEQQPLFVFLRTKLQPNKIRVYNSAVDLIRGRAPDGARSKADDDDDDEEDDEEDEDDSDADEDDSDVDSDFDSEDDDDSDDERPRKKSKTEKKSKKDKKEKSGKKEKKDKSDKKEKKDKSDKKEKKDKSDKKEKKDKSDKKEKKDKSDKKEKKDKSDKKEKSEKKEKKDKEKKSKRDRDED